MGVCCTEQWLDLNSITSGNTGCMRVHFRFLMSSSLELLSGIVVGCLLQLLQLRRSQLLQCFQGTLLTGHFSSVHLLLHTLHLQSFMYTRLLVPLRGAWCLQEGEEFRRSLIRYESEMLKAFGFIMNVEHPHRLLCNYCHAPL